MKVIEEVVNNNSGDMLVPFNKKRKNVMRAKKLLGNVPDAPLENDSFHSKESVLK